MLSLQYLFLLFPTLLLAQPLEERAPKFAATTTFTFSGDTLPTGLVIDTGLIGASGGLLKHKFDTQNVAVADGYLQLTVPGAQKGKQVISSAEVATDFDVLHGSVRTYAILTETPGVCNGMFFYASDSQEIDIEWISDPSSLSNLNSPNGTRAMQYTNQAIKAGNKPTSFYGPAPDDATSALHEYRVDWTARSTKYYLDGVLQRTERKNVPSQAGAWVWNNWNNGNPNWTGPPPTTDAVFKIQKIVMYYNSA